MTSRRFNKQTVFKMATTALLMISIAFATGCAAPRKVVVVDKNHHHAIKPGYVVYTNRPKHKTCYRHKGHWHCR